MDKVHDQSSSLDMKPPRRQQQHNDVDEDSSNTRRQQQQQRRTGGGQEEVGNNLDVRSELQKLVPEGFEFGRTAKNAVGISRRISSSQTATISREIIAVWELLMRLRRRGMPERRAQQTPPSELLQKNARIVVGGTAAQDARVARHSSSDRRSAVGQDQETTASERQTALRFQDVLDSFRSVSKNVLGLELDQPTLVARLPLYLLGLTFFFFLAGVCLVCCANCCLWGRGDRFLRRQLEDCETHRGVGRPAGRGRAAPAAVLKKSSC